jgi:uncharacterized protein YdeI (YjbR/CyaY-like superfamily)
MAELDAAGRLEAPGRAAFARRNPTKTGRASYETEEKSFTPEQLKQLKANKAAYAFFESMPPGYKRTVKHWVTTAKQEATRERRLATLIELSAKGERIPAFISPPGKTTAKR